MTECFLLWYIAGLLLSLYWPFRYRDGMRPEDWESFLMQLPFLCLFGPFAIVAAFPL